VISLKTNNHYRATSGRALESECEFQALKNFTATSSACTTPACRADVPNKKAPAPPTGEQNRRGQHAEGPAEQDVAQVEPSEFAPVTAGESEHAPVEESEGPCRQHPPRRRTGLFRARPPLDLLWIAGRRTEAALCGLHLGRVEAVRPADEGYSGFSSGRCREFSGFTAGRRATGACSF